MCHYAWHATEQVIILKFGSLEVYTFFTLDTILTLVLEHKLGDEMLIIKRA